MTSHYKQLLSCEKQIRKSFITKTVLSNPNTSVSQQRIRSYRLLSHAEIEFYLESIVLAKVAEAKRKWSSTNSIPSCIASILACNTIKLNNLPALLSEISTGNDVQSRINEIVSTFERSVKKNNGIKEGDIIPLLIPLGIDYSNINQTLLNNLSSFGKDRGHTAHNSSKVQQLINPADEVLAVDQILADLLSIDNLVSSIR